MATGNDKRTVAQLRHELRERGMATTGNKKMLTERLLLTNPTDNILRQSPESRPVKRRRMAEPEPDEDQREHVVTQEENDENASVTDEQNLNRQTTHLSEWERDLQRREERLHLEETKFFENQRLSVETLTPRLPVTTSNQPPPFKLALRTIGLRDIIEILPEFDPDNRSTIDARQFAERVTLLKHTYGWEDGLVVLAVPAKLRGNAKIWADTQRSIHHSWDDFAADLMKNFPNHRRESDAHIELANTRRNTEESLSQLCNWATSRY